jgi:hypothetical protein
MNDKDVYNDEEMREIRQFLHNSYVRATEGFSFARSTNPQKAADPELKRLAKKRPRSKGQDVISEEDIKELADAIESPFAADLADKKKLTLDILKRQIPKGSSDKRESLARLILKNSVKNLCKDVNETRLKTFAITAAGLSLVLKILGIDPTYAPVAVWFATRLRDLGLPVLCSSVQTYLKQEETT